MTSVLAFDESNSDGSSPILSATGSPLPTLARSKKVTFGYFTRVDGRCWLGGAEWVFTFIYVYLRFGQT